jgi:predicted nucleic acid-binding protein
VGQARIVSTSAGVTLDAGALIALERGDRRMLALLEQILAQRLELHVPAGVVGQTWRDRKRQVTLARFLRAKEVRVIPLDAALARACGELCGSKSTTDVVDAAVVLSARRTGDRIVTSDPRDLRHLDSKSVIISV